MARNSDARPRHEPPAGGPPFQLPIFTDTSDWPRRGGAANSNSPGRRYWVRIATRLALVLAALGVLVWAGLF